MVTVLLLLLLLYVFFIVNDYAITFSMM